MPKENIHKQIETILKSPKVCNFIKNLNKSQNNQISSTCNVIGEVMTYCFVHSSKEKITVDEIINYLKKVTNAKSEDYTRTRIQALKESIGDSLNLKDIETNENRDKIKDYFLQNYVTNGFVSHSFSGACKESILKNGFSSSVRLWDNQEIMNVAKTFEKHGVLFSVGGYSHYSGGGMYVEHNQKQSYWHALSSPEWFKWFTSANHNQSGNNIKESPFYLKDKNACKQNVMDLCTNSKLSDEETKEVMNLFEKTWKTLGTKQMCTALIPRSEIGKNNIDKTIPKDASLEESMVYALNDLNGQFSEHNGNCLTETLYANQMQILDLPNADKFVSCKDYKRETKKELLNPKQIFDRINGGLIASNNLSLSDNQVSNLMKRLNEEYSDEQSILNYINNRHQQLLEYPNYNVNSSTKIIPITQDEIDEVKENNPDEFEMCDEIEIKKDNKQKNHISSIEKE